LAVKIIPVTGKMLLRRFIEIPYTVHRNDPLWIPPLRVERSQNFSPRHNDFFRRAEVALFIAEKDGRDAGRISAQIDPLLSEAGMAETGHFGCLSAIDDSEVFAALTGAAEGFLRERGKTRMLGPFSMSIKEEMGLLVEGFDTPPMLLMGHDPEYAAPHLERLGFVKEKDVYAYLTDLTVPMSKSGTAMLRRPPAHNVVLRGLDFSDYENEIRKLVDIFNDAWSGNWGFVPMTQAETSALGKHLRLLLDKRLVRFAEVDGRAEGFIVVLPNINEAIRDLRGNLFPFGWARLLWRLKVRGAGSARVPLMGVRRGISGTMQGAAMPLHLIASVWDAAMEMGFRQVELSWILEDNLPMRRILEKFGARRYKTYRIYGKSL
jgi:hypothetical protein